MRRICARTRQCDLPKATNIRPACMLIIQGMERRSMKAGGSKLSCAVRLTCAQLRRILESPRCRCGGGRNDGRASSLGQRFERVEVVHPLLHGHVARAVHARALPVTKAASLGGLAARDFRYRPRSRSGPCRGRFRPGHAGRRRRHGAGETPGASAFCTLRVSAAGRRRSSPRSQHHSVTGRGRHLARRGRTVREIRAGRAPRAQRAAPATGRCRPPRRCRWPAATGA